MRKKALKIRCVEPNTGYTSVSVPFDGAGFSSALMPKMKSHSGAKKRLRRTGSGKLAFKRRGRSHLLQQKSKRQKRINRTVMANSRDLARHEHLIAGR